jgi:hypothetical protein
MMSFRQRRKPRNHAVSLDQIAARKPKDGIAEYDSSSRGMQSLCRTKKTWPLERNHFVERGL